MQVRELLRDDCSTFSLKGTDVLALGLCGINAVKILLVTAGFSPVAVNIGNSGGVGESSFWDGGMVSGTLRKLLQGEPVSSSGCLCQSLPQYLL